MEIESNNGQADSETGVLENRTPEFVIWAIVDQSQTGPHFCTLRQTAGDSPSRILRELKPLIALDQANEQNRRTSRFCFQGTPQQIQLAQTAPTNAELRQIKAFDIAEVTEYYGGEQHIKETCDNCEANVRRPFFSHAICGCAGIVANLPSDNPISEQLKKLDTALWAPFKKNKSRWHRLWLNNAPTKQQLEALHSIFQSLLKSQSNPAVSHLLEAIRFVLPSDTFNIQTEFIPSGIQFKKNWIIQPHCSMCKSTMSKSDSSCKQCGKVGFPHPEIKRKASGDRPYRSLLDFVNENDAITIVHQYLNPQE